MPYLISSGKVTQNNQPTPMYISPGSILNGQCISVAKEYADIKVGIDLRRSRLRWRRRPRARRSRPP
jgi:hypothetical protein